MCIAGPKVDSPIVANVLRGSGLVFVLVALAGCITVTGQTGKEIKEDLTSGFAYQTAELLYPSGSMPNSAEDFPELSKRQVREVQKNINEYADQLNTELGQNRSWIATQVQSSLHTDSEIKVRVTNRGVPITRINSDGEVEIDVKVVQGVFRGSLVEGLRESRFATFGGSSSSNSAKSDDELLRSYLEVRDDINSTPGRGAVGMIFEMFDDEDSWGDLIDFRESTSSVELKFTAAIFFLVAHEMGHLALQHLENPSQSQEEFTNKELQADQFAAYLLAHAQKSILPYLDTTEETFFNDFSAQDLIGFRDLFDYGYERAGYAEFGAVATFQHPPKERRIEVCLEALEAVMAQATDELEEESQRESDERQREWDAYSEERRVAAEELERLWLIAFPDDMKYGVTMDD